MDFVWMYFAFTMFKGTLSEHKCTWLQTTNGGKKGEA